MVSRRRLVATAVLVCVLSACGGADAEDALTGSGTDTALASLGVIARDTLVGTARADFRDGRDGEALRVGNTVKTSETGFAELSYFDGSFTRVDRGAEYTLIALEPTDGARRVSAELVSGRSWNRVQKAAGADDTFEVDTPVATASVRGTAFVIDCSPADRCVFSVIEGTVIVTPRGGAPVILTAPAELTVTKAATPVVTPRAVTLAELLTDPFTRTNLDIDTTKKKLPVIVAAATTTTSAATTTPTATTTASAPTTQPPVTQPPVTQPPVTQPPVTEPPVTAPPVTQPPVTAPPTTPPPPTTAAPNLDLTGTWQITMTNAQLHSVTGCWTGASVALANNTVTVTATSPTCSGNGTQQRSVPPSTPITCQGSSCSTGVPAWGQLTLTRTSATSHNLSGNVAEGAICGPPVGGLTSAQQSADGNTVTFSKLYEGGCASGSLFQLISTIVFTRIG